MTALEIERAGARVAEVVKTHHLQSDVRLQVAWCTCGVWIWRDEDDFGPRFSGWLTHFYRTILDAAVDAAADLAVEKLLRWVDEVMDLEPALSHPVT